MRLLLCLFVIAEAGILSSMLGGTVKKSGEDSVKKTPQIMNIGDTPVTGATGEHGMKPSEKGESCIRYRSITATGCGDACLEKKVGICTRHMVVVGGNMTEGYCAEAGYKKGGVKRHEPAGPCGIVEVELYSKTKEGEKVLGCDVARKRYMAIVKRLEHKRGKLSFKVPNSCDFYDDVMKMLVEKIKVDKEKGAASWLNGDEILAVIKEAESIVDHARKTAIDEIDYDELSAIREEGLKARGGN